jgi:glycine reductase complex component B subunit gamma
MIRVVHYLNQFFAGAGGEACADVPVTVLPGAIGPGILLREKIKGWGDVVRTVYAGDNFAHERSDEARTAIIDAVRAAAGELLVAGPAFNAGRYGLACGLAATAVQRALGIPVVMGCSPENPAVDEHRSSVLIVPTADSALGMPDAVAAMATLARKLALGLPIGPAAEDGYLPRGRRLNVMTGVPAAERAVELLLSRLRGGAATTEIPIDQFDTVPPPPPLATLAGRRVALVTEAGVVPRGNPHGIPHRRSTVWARYSLRGQPCLDGERYEASHGGYNTAWAREDPNRILPVDAMRDLAREGAIGELHEEYFVTCGNSGNVSVMRRMGREMAAELVAAGVDAVILTAT